MALHDRDYMRGRHSFRWKDLLLPDAVTALILLNVAVFVLQHYFHVAVDETGKGWGAFSLAALQDGRVWTLFTHLFVHQGLVHVIGNCLLIFFAGKAVQALLGPKSFLYIYFLSGVVGAACQAVFGLGVGHPQTVIGATAAAYGTFLALASMLPQESVSAMLHFLLPARLRFWTVAVCAMAVSSVLALLQIIKVLPLDISHFAHLGGALAGWWFVRLLGYGGPPVTYERMWHERQRTEEARAFAGVPRRKRTARVAEEPAVTLPPVNTRDFIAQEIDPLLDKIAEHGINSLSGEEREMLDRAREEIMRRDQSGGTPRK